MGKAGGTELQNKAWKENKTPNKNPGPDKGVGLVLFCAGKSCLTPEERRGERWGWGMQGSAPVGAFPVVKPALAANRDLIDG